MTLFSAPHDPWSHRVRIVLADTSLGAIAKLSTRESGAFQPGRAATATRKSASSSFQRCQVSIAAYWSAPISSTSGVPAGSSARSAHSVS